MAFAGGTSEVASEETVLLRFLFSALFSSSLDGVAGELSAASTFSWTVTGSAQYKMLLIVKKRRGFLSKITFASLGFSLGRIHVNINTELVFGGGGGDGRSLVSISLVLFHRRNNFVALA